MKLPTGKIARIYKKIDLFGDQKIVLLEAPTDGSWPKSDCLLNIYCIDSSDEIVWQILAPESKFDTDSFVSLVFEDGLLKASRFFGAEFNIDVQSGIAEEVGWHK